jgi:hypothetical protein
VLVIARAVHNQVISGLIQIRPEICTRTLAGSKLLEKLREYVANNVIRYDWIVTEPERVLINGGCKLIEDGRERFFVKFLGGLKQ